MTVFWFLQQLHTLSKKQLGRVTQHKKKPKEQKWPGEAPVNFS